VNAARGVELTVQTSGIVETILFTANQRVEQGATLVQLDDAIEAADLAATETQAALDQQSLQRAIELTEKGVGTTANLDAARAAASASAAQVDKLSAASRRNSGAFRRDDPHSEDRVGVSHPGPSHASDIDRSRRFHHSRAAPRPSGWTSGRSVTSDTCRSMAASPASIRRSMPRAAWSRSVPRSTIPKAS
jgi:pyruvate/2-oxoglutarate dehydrogenase complex dihydrolipoamide acyltransferase (E2) component